MAYDVAKLLTMSQSELDALFTNSAPGNIPDGEADGTAIVAPGTTYSSNDCQIRQPFCLARKSIRRKKRRAAKSDFALWAECNTRESV